MWPPDLLTPRQGVKRAWKMGGVFWSALTTHSRPLVRPYGGIISARGNRLHPPESRMGRREYSPGLEGFILLRLPRTAPAVRDYARPLSHRPSGTSVCLAMLPRHANDPGQRPRATDARRGPKPQSRGSLRPLCSAFSWSGHLSANHDRSQQNVQTAGARRHRGGQQHNCDIARHDAILLHNNRHASRCWCM